jgi:hypothetical protein
MKFKPKYSIVLLYIISQKGKNKGGNSAFKKPILIKATADKTIKIIIFLLFGFRNSFKFINYYFGFQIKMYSKM